MKTTLLELNQLEKAAMLLKNGEIVAFPTETVFGMGVIYDDLRAFEKLKEAKGRDAHKPFTLIVSRTSEISDYAIVNKAAKAIINKYMPGPLTIVLPAKSVLIGPITNNSSYIGIRVSSDEYVAKLINLVGKPLLVPSANKSGTTPLLNSDDVYKVFNGDISAIIVGKAGGSKASTVIKIDDKIELVREGVIPFENLKQTHEEAKK